MPLLIVVVHSDGLLLDAPVFGWENCTFNPLLFIVVDKLSKAQLRLQLNGNRTYGGSVGFAVIFFHGQIIPSQIDPLNSQIFPQNSPFIPHIIHIF